MENKKNWIVLAAFMFLCACSTTPVDVTYTPDPAIVAAAKASPVVALGTVTDSRKNGPNWLGAIRGGFGNPMKVLETKQPVVEVVKTALADGLTSVHALTGSNPQYTFTAEMVRFDCNQLARREAHIVLNVSLTNTSSQQVVYTKTLKADKVTGSMITFDAGIFASVDDLRQVANDVL